MDALNHLAKEHDEMRMLIKGIERHMQKNPWSDDELMGALLTLKAYVDTIIGA